MKHIHSTGARAVITLAAGLCLAVAARAQISPTQPPPLLRQPPSSEAVCSIHTSCADLAPAMIQSAASTSPLESNLRYLTDSIGGRVTGSPAADRAVGWAVEALRRAGVDEVHTEKFQIPAGWSEGHTRFDILSPEPFPVRLVSIAWSSPTPEGGITADVVDAGDGDAAGFAKAGAAAKGAIVLVHSKLLVTWDDLGQEYSVMAGIAQRASDTGAVALLWMSSRPNLLLYRHTVAGAGQIDQLPQAVLAREDAERMARFLAAAQKVRVHFDMPNHITGPVQSENVIAEIRGREKPDEFVLLGAHLDSWDLGTGALDNGCNAALVIDAARVIRATGVPPRRSIRFALFTGEEQGMLGSWAYARAHRAELDRMIAAIVFDGGNGAVTGFWLGGRKDILPAVQEALAPAAALGVKDFTFDIETGTDELDFLLEGVPTLVAYQEPSNYILNYHASSDTFDKVDIPELKRHVAIAAIAAYALADREQRIGPRLSRAEVELTLKENHLDQNAGLKWSQWQNGQRGRQP
jgi:carboxypeptidase Q